MGTVAEKMTAIANGIREKTGVTDALTLDDMAAGVEAVYQTGWENGIAQLPTKAAETFTPGTADQTIASGQYLTGPQTIKGDANLLPKNILSGVSIFGVNGAAEAGGESSGGGYSGDTVTIVNNLSYAIFIGCNNAVKSGGSLVVTKASGNFQWLSFTIHSLGSTNTVANLTVTIDGVAVKINQLAYGVLKSGNANIAVGVSCYLATAPAAGSTITLSGI